ncbi:hypothetical protein VIGAN_11140100, partial [Vigna angularis var. angularis]
VELVPATSSSSSLTCAFLAHLSLASFPLGRLSELEPLHTHLQNRTKPSIEHLVCTSVFLHQTILLPTFGSWSCSILKRGAASITKP